MLLRMTDEEALLRMTGEDALPRMSGRRGAPQNDGGGGRGVTPKEGDYLNFAPRLIRGGVSQLQMGRWRRVPASPGDQAANQAN